MYRILGIDVGTCDLAAIVDADRFASKANGVRVIDNCEVFAPVLNVAVTLEVIGACDIASFVDLKDECAAGRIRIIDSG